MVPCAPPLSLPEATAQPGDRGPRQHRGAGLFPGGLQPPAPPPPTAPPAAAAAAASRGTPQEAPCGAGPRGEGGPEEGLPGEALPVPQDHRGAGLAAAPQDQHRHQLVPQLQVGGPLSARRGWGASAWSWVMKGGSPWLCVGPGFGGVLTVACNPRGDSRGLRAVLRLMDAKNISCTFKQNVPRRCGKVSS